VVSQEESSQQMIHSQPVFTPKKNTIGHPPYDTPSIPSFKDIFLLFLFFHHLGPEDVSQPSVHIIHPTEARRRGWGEVPAKRKLVIAFVILFPQFKCDDQPNHRHWRPQDI